MFTRILKTLTFLTLLEYQVFFGNGGFSVESAIALAALALICFIEGYKSSRTYRPAYLSGFTIPSIFLFLMNYLIGGLIGQNIAYQFIVALSAVVYYESLSKRDILITRLERGELSLEKFRHFLFHCWSKYLNLFLGLWLFFVIKAKDIINENMEHVLLPLFLILFTVFTYGAIRKLKIRDIVGIVAFTGLLILVDIFLDLFFQGGAPPHFMALALFVAYDLGDIYIHAREFGEINSAVWEQKVVVYVLATIFIAQLYALQTDPYKNLSNIYTSILNSRGTEDSINSDNSTPGKIDVPDRQNSSISRKPASMVPVQ